MSKVVAPITAVVEFITAVKSGEYGDYQSVLFKDEQGEKIWKSFDPDSEELALLKKGMRVQLIETGKSKSGKPSHNIVLLDAPTARPVTAAPVPNPAPSIQQQIVTKEVKRAIAQDIETSAKLYRYCYETAQVQMEGLIDDPVLLKDIASTLFIQALRG